jgi:hypothetical protein
MNIFQDAPRGLSQICTAERSLNTTYNGDLKVPPYVGIMFEMSALSDVAVLTLEFDIRWDKKPTDLSVEVYTMTGNYVDEKRFHQPGLWLLHASTTLVLALEGNSAVIPVTDFIPVHIPANEKRSFYVTMKGPYLDHNVYALQKTGEIQITGDDLQLFVGSGFTRYKFPAAIDTIVHPMFAGIIHYEKTFDCNDALAAKTHVDFQFLFEKENLDGGLALSSAVESAVDRLLESSAVLRTFVEEYGLQKSSAAVTNVKGYACKYSEPSVFHFFQGKDSLFI